MLMLPVFLRRQAQQLRQRGKTYSEIKTLLRVDIPKSTLSYWCRNIILPKSYHAKVRRLNELSFVKAREISSKNRKEKREIFLKDLDLKNKRLLNFFACNGYSRKIVLAVLYLAEGSKTARGSLMFGNSDRAIVLMFVNLLRECYKIDEQKFRCTVQCRADQDIKKAERFWAQTTKISPKQFYKARIDKRTFGQISKKQDYKGGCRIDYFSSVIDLELKRIAQQMLKSFG